MSQIPAPNLAQGQVGKSSPLTQDARFGGRIQRTLEIWISLALVVMAFAFMTPIFRGMATSSLSTDERGTVTRYSARGPWRTITSYDLAKNHIFFNLVNSVTPGSKSLNSLRVRFWSYLFLAASFLAILTYFIRRGWFLEGALCIYFLGVNPEWIMLNLMARGYGFLSFAAIALSLLGVRYCETGDRRTLKALCVLTALGVWTVPSFVIFGSALLLFLLLATRRREVFLSGAATAGAIAVLYAPVLRQVLNVMHKYQGRYGEEYATMESVAATLRVYLLPLGDPVLFAILFGAFVAPFALWTRAEPIGRALRVMMGAVFVFFLACLAMKTPPLRTTAFVIGPMVLCLAHAFGLFWRDARLTAARPWIALALAVPLQVHANQARACYRFIPQENWLDMARAIETIFPKNTSTFGGSNTLSAYVENRYPDLSAFDKESFLDGKSVVIHSLMNLTHKREVSVADLSPRVRRIQIPQQVGDFQDLWFVIPSESGIAGITPAQGSVPTGWSLTTSGTLALKFRSGVPFYSLNLLVKQGAGTAQVQAEAVINGTRQPMQSYQAGADRLYSLRLADKPLTDAEVRFSSPAPGIHVSVTDIWTYPSAPPKESGR